MKAKPELNKYYIKKKNIRLFHHFYRLDFSTIKLVPFALLYQINLRTYSPPTSCQRLGPCLSRSWWSWSLPALKNRPSVTTTWTKTKSNWNFINHQLVKIKCFTLEKTWTRQQICCWNNWPNGATEHDPGDRKTMSWHQGGAVVPDEVTIHR